MNCYHVTVAMNVHHGNSKTGWMVRSSPVDILYVSYVSVISSSFAESGSSGFYISYIQNSIISLFLQMMAEV